jgi:hypothetical protein
LQKVARAFLKEGDEFPRIRAERIYALYVTQLYSPYIYFRIAFAIALLLSEDSPELACDFLFEGLFVCLHVAPKFTRLPAVRSALRFFAELLDRIDRYCYAAQIFDLLFLSDPTDISGSSVVHICSARRDDVRALFHLGQALRGFASQESRLSEALYICQSIAALIAEHGLIQDSIEILCGMLHRTFRIPVATRNVDPTHSGDGFKDRTLQPIRPSRQTSTSSLSSPSQPTVNSIVAGIVLAYFLIKRRYFKLANNLLMTLTQLTKGSTLGSVVKCVQAKLFNASNEFDLFRRTLPTIDLSSIHSLTSFRVLTSTAVSFDVSFATLKLLAKANLERRFWGHALFWSEVLIGAIPSVSYRNVGAAFLLRGRALALALWQHWGTTGEISLEVSRGPLMAAVGDYLAPPRLSRTDLLSETLASFRMARTCQERIGGLAGVMHATVELVNLLLHHFLDGQTGDIVIGEPRLFMKSSLHIKRRPSCAAPPVVVSQQNACEFIGGLLASLSQTAAKTMYLPMVIASQILTAKLKILSGNFDPAKQYFDFAFENFQHYFMSGNALSARDLRPTMLTFLHGLLMNLCHCLLSFERNFVNDRLIVFDWLSDVDSLLVNCLRLVPEDNTNPIEASKILRISTFKSIAPHNLPDFLRTLQLRSDDSGEDSTSALLARARANIRLCELQRLRMEADESTMTAANRSICLRLASCHASRPSPIDTPTYTSLIHSASIAKHTIFVQRLFHSIYVYVPHNGALRRVRLTQGTELSFSVSAHCGDVPFATTSTLFEPDFYALAGMLLLCDKKQRHGGFDASAAADLARRARIALFADIGSDAAAWPVFPDDCPFGDRRLRGALFSLETSPDPLLFVTSGDLRGLPIEMMFPAQLVLRCWSFAGLARRPARVLSPPVPTVCRWKGDPDHLMASAIRRSFECVQRLLQGCGAPTLYLPYVDGVERTVCFPFPLFSSNQDDGRYGARFSFCEVIDVVPGNFCAGGSQLFIFTVSDFCEMPAGLEKLVRDEPFAYFMFIPAQFVREAFAMMIPIFERHQKRKAYLAKIEDMTTERATRHFVVSSVAFDFITLLQGTLIRALGCGISLIVPGC